MIEPGAIIAARRFGEIRYSVVSDYSGSLSNVLGKFGLLPDSSQLVELDRDSALTTLAELLWKDMAYNVECMPKSQAEDFARNILGSHEVKQSKYYSNRQDWNKGWNPFTESTFDSGLIVTGEANHYFCIWFQDED